jgi:hypothetical protein
MIYNNLKEGKAINISIIAGVIVHISSINVPWFEYLLLNTLAEKLTQIDNIIHNTVNNIPTK